jgi:hypothetical protein
VSVAAVAVAIPLIVRATATSARLRRFILWMFMFFWVLTDS